MIPESDVVDSQCSEQIVDTRLVKLFTKDCRSLHILGRVENIGQSTKDSWHDTVRVNYARACSTNFFRGGSPTKEEANASTVQPNKKKKKKKKNRRYVVDSGGSPHMMGEMSIDSQERSIRKTKDVFEIQTAIASVPLHQRSEGYFSCTCGGWRKTLVQYWLWSDYAMSWNALAWQTEKITSYRKVRRPSHAALTTLFFSSWSESKKCLHH